MKTWRRRAVNLLRNHWWFFVIGLALTMFFLAPLFWFGVAHAEPSIRMVMRADPQGNAVRVLKIEGVDCPVQISGGTLNEGCYFHGYVTFVNGPHGLANAQANTHEDEHVAGLRHGPWMPMGNGDKCALITAQGYTRWAVGNLLCRRNDGGDYYQIAP